MTRIHRGLLLTILLAVITLPAIARGRAVGAPANPTTPTAASFAKTEKEA